MMLSTKAMGLPMMLRRLQDGERGPGVHRDIDLEPTEWRAPQGHPGEPVFGPGLPAAIAWLFTFGLTVAVTHWLTHLH